MNRELLNILEKAKPNKAHIMSLLKAHLSVLKLRISLAPLGMGSFSIIVIFSTRNFRPSAQL